MFLRNVKKSTSFYWCLTLNSVSVLAFIVIISLKIKNAICKKRLLVYKGVGSSEVELIEFYQISLSLAGSKPISPLLPGMFCDFWGRKDP